MLNRQYKNEKKNKLSKKNHEDYPDPTAYDAIVHVEDGEDAEEPVETRLNRLLTVIFAACELADFHLEERIVVRDRTTGKIWR